LEKDHHGSRKIAVQAEPASEQQIGPKSADKETALKDRSLVAKFLN